MRIPEQLRDIVDRLGNAMVQALAQDADTRALAREIQERGFDITLILEATIALHERDRDDGAGAEFSLTESGTQWSEEDKAFLRTYRIAR